MSDKELGNFLESLASVFVHYRKCIEAGVNAEDGKNLMPVQSEIEFYMEQDKVTKPFVFALATIIIEIFGDKIETLCINDLIGPN